MITAIDNYPHWQVMFCSNHVAVVTTLNSKDEDSALIDAANLISREHGWDLTGFAANVERID